MEKWVVTAKRADFQGIAKRFGIDPVVARVITNRGIVGDEAIRTYLYGGTDDLKDPLALKDMDRASAIVKEKIRSGARIRVIGDYDIDGIMASYILKRGITELGGQVDIRIPNRMKDGYGISEDMVRKAHDEGVDTIITCDNGIAAHAQADLARSLGMTFVVTDHHEVTSLPAADAVVDPRREDDSSGSENLCGAAVAWKLILAMGGDRALDLIAYAAFATVGDIVALTGENRIIVKEGLKRLRETDNIGLRMLAEATGTHLASLNTYHIGFILGPCLNASGRLMSADKAVELLLSRSEAEARRYAEELKSLNESRKAMTDAGVEAAVNTIETHDLLSDRVLVVYLPDVHESVAGIIAGRIRERYARPVFILTRGEEAVKGSGRSIEAYSMFEELRCASDLLVRFGGHPMAAGLTLQEEKIDELRARLNAHTTLSDEDLIPKVRIDVPMPVSYVTPRLISQLELLEPCGKGNERPLFAQKHVLFEHPRLFGARRNLLRAQVLSMTAPGDAAPDKIGFHPATEGPALDAICFRNVEELYSRIRDNPDIAIAYEPEINEYMGLKSVQIVINHFQ